MAGLAAFAGVASLPTLWRSASIKLTTLPVAVRSFGVIGLPGAFLVDQVDQGGLVLVLELFWFERAGRLIDDVPGELEHVLGDFDFLDLVEILVRRTNSVG